jgi:hypothetical protein
VDLITEKNGEPFAIEIKSTKKPVRDDMRGLLYWKKLVPNSNLLLYHGGSISDTTVEGLALSPWSEIDLF